jgi:predicted DNA-binding protein YlxM (UPF0122 family)
LPPRILCDNSQFSPGDRRIYCETKTLDSAAPPAYNLQDCKGKWLYITKEVFSVADDTVQRTMLFDFYGELLTDKQREYYDLHYNEDLSLSEIAEQTGVSRQAVWDIIRRAGQILEDMEAKTGLVRRFTSRRETVRELESQLSELRGLTEGVARQKADAAYLKLLTLED